MAQRRQPEVGDLYRGRHGGEMAVLALGPEWVLIQHPDRTIPIVHDRSVLGKWQRITTPPTTAKGARCLSLARFFDR